MSARRSRPEALKPIHRMVRDDSPRRSPGRNDFATGDALTWRPWCACSPIAAAQHRHGLDLADSSAREGRYVETRGSPLDVLKTVIETQHKDIEEQMGEICEKLSRSIMDMKGHIQEAQGKQEALLGKIEHLVQGFTERLEKHWLHEEQGQRPCEAISEKGGLIRQMASGKLPDVVARTNTLRDGSSSARNPDCSSGDKNIAPIAEDVLGKVEDPACLVEVQEPEEPKDVELQLPKRSFSKTFSAKLSNMSSKIGQFFSRDPSKYASAEDAETETAHDRTKKRKSRKSTAADPQKSRKSTDSAVNDKKKRKKHKDFTLDREDDDISLFLVADKVDMQALVDQELERWELTENQKQFLMPTNGVLARWVGSRWFRFSVNVLIVINVICIAIQGEHAVDRARQGEKPLIAFLLLDTIFCGLFFLEIALRLLAERIVFCVGPHWRQNFFDSAFVVSDIVNQLFTFVLQGADISYVSGLRTGVKMIRLARAARALRLFRIVRGATRCRLLLEETAASMSLGIWLTVLLWVLLTFFGIFFMQAAADSLLDQPHGHVLQTSLLDDFGSSPDAVFTLFKLISGGKTWSDTFHDLHKVDIVYAVVFIAFVIIIAFLFLNVVTSVFVDSALQRSRQHEVEHKGEDADQIRNLLNMVKIENLEGFVSKKGFVQFLSTPFGKEQLMMLGLESAEALGIYELLDKDEKKQINIEELASGCARFTQPVRAADNVALLLAIRKLTKEQRIFADYVQQRFFALTHMLRLVVQGSPTLGED